MKQTFINKTTLKDLIKTIKKNLTLSVALHI